MTGQSIAEITWRALDTDGRDICRLARADHGWLMIGHARFRHEQKFAALDYVIRCDADWTTLSADIAGLEDDSGVRIHVARDDGAWLVNGEDQSGLGGATDIDLSFTPATNLMPLRRLRRSRDNDLETRAAWLVYPTATLRPLDQTYRRTGTAGRIAYTARQTGFSATFDVNDHGFVTHYPGFWQAEAQHVSL